MKLDILRLGSVVPEGVGGPEAAAIGLIYDYLLDKYNQTPYRYIRINQIGDDLKEFILKESPRKIYINIRYPVPNGFRMYSDLKKNIVRLEVAHISLLRIAEYENKLEKDILAKIKQEILQNQFNFDITYKEKKNPTNVNLSAKIVVKPYTHEFKIYAQILLNNEITHRILLYIGIPSSFYLEKYFHYIKWKDENTLIVSGKDKIVEMHIDLKMSSVEYKNLTRYAKPPYFELMKANLSKDEKEKAEADWKHSLPPSSALIIRNHQN